MKLSLHQKIIEYIFEHELQSLYLLAPVAAGLGIITYFNLSFEPKLLYCAAALFSFILLSILSFRFDKFFFITIFITLFIAGFTSATFRTATVKSPVLQSDEKPIWVRAKLENIEKNGKFAKLILTEPDLWQPDIKKFPPEVTPYRIRITARTEIDEDIRVGNIVAFKAILETPATKPIFPGGYDFAKVAYFNKIGAVGYSISPVTLFEKTEPGLIEKFQDYYYRKVHENIKDKDLAGMIIAQITADRFEISDELQEKVRNAGLSHLLAISGMNMTVVMVWCFFLSRTFLSLFPTLALSYDTKKLSCFVAIILGFTYLMVTGLPVSAIRAFLMTLVFFIAILFDRFSFSLHTVAVAALGIMLIMPEQILFPSFQLSFAAVIGLIGFYDLYQKYLKKPNKYDPGILKKTFFIIAGVISTTLFASITTTPFIIFHFGTVQNYSILANLICVPIVELLLLPFAFFAILMMPLGLEWAPLKLAGLGAIVLRDISLYVSSKEDSVSHFAALPDNFLWLIAFGFFILFIFKTRIRFIGVPLIFLGFSLIFQPLKKPDLVVNESGSLIAMKNDNDNYEYIGSKRKSFALYQFTSKLGEEETMPHAQECSKKQCIYKNIILGNTITQKNCSGFDYLVNLGKNKITCENTLVIDKETLKQKGTHLLYLDEKKLVTASDSLKNRPWYGR